MGDFPQKPDWAWEKGVGRAEQNVGPRTPPPVRAPGMSTGVHSFIDRLKTILSA